MQLLTRLFKYRCSYMIYSLTFQNLMPQLKKTVLNDLWVALQGKGTANRYSYLKENERHNIIKILAETLPNAPTEWKQAVAAK